MTDGAWKHEGIKAENSAGCCVTKIIEKHIKLNKTISFHSHFNSSFTHSFLQSAACNTCSFKRCLSNARRNILPAVKHSGTSQRLAC
jgi:hypothetical protein